MYRPSFYLLLLGKGTFYFKELYATHTLVFFSIRKWKLDALNFWNAHSFWGMPEKKKIEGQSFWDMWSNSSIHQGNFGFTSFSIHRIVEGLKRYNSLFYEHFPFLSPLLFFSVLYSHLFPQLCGCVKLCQSFNYGLHRWNLKPCKL